MKVGKARAVAGNLLVKFRADGPARLTQCAERTLEQRGSFATATADRSSSLDALVSKFSVSKARALLRERTGLSTATAQAKRVARLGARTGANAGNVAQLPDVTNVYLLELSPGADVEAVAQAFASDPHVEYAQPNYIAKATYVPNDTYYATSGSFSQPYRDLWGLQNMRAQTAWDAARGAGVTVAVVDTGVDRSHPDLSGNVWSDSVEVMNGVDDDGNGYVDDAFGWDFAKGDNDPTDEHGHGTHVAGTIAAQDNNAQGIVGVAPDARIMGIRGLDENGSGSMFSLAEAVVYAAENGARVINNSWGCSGCPSNPVIEDAVKLAHGLGAVVVFAAGNDSADVKTASPQNYPYALTVSSVDPSDTKSGFSNWGVVDVAAPGSGYDVSPPDFAPFRGILSLKSEICSQAMCPPELIVGTQYLRQAGTSMAAPHVAGLAALILSKNPEYTQEQVRQLIRGGSIDAGAPGFDLHSGYGRVDAQSALSQPVPLEALITGPIPNVIEGGSSVAITGTAKGAQFSSYRVEYGTGNLPESWSLIAQANATVTNGTLANWNLNTVSDGEYTLRVVAQTSDGRSYEDRQLVLIDKVSIDTPAVGSVIRGGGNIAITGTVAPSAFTSYSVNVRNLNTGLYQSSSEITLESGGTAPVTDGLLATWNTASAVAGHYAIELVASTTNGQVLETASLIVDPSLHPGWPQRLEIIGGGGFQLSNTDALTAADVNGDGTKELVVAYGKDFRVIDHTGALLPGWPQNADPFNTGTVTQRSPAVGDLDGNGDMELVGSNNDGLFFVWNADGTAYPGWPRNLGTLGSIAIADLDENGVNDIITTDWWGGVNALRVTGEYLPGFPKYPGSGVTAAPSVADMDGDGHLDIVITSQGHSTTVVDRFGNTLPGFPVMGGPTYWDGPMYQAVGDLDGNGDLEIVSVYVDGDVHVFNHDGTPVPGWPKLLSETHDTTRGSTPSIGDIDGDGRPEVLVGTQMTWGNSVLFAWHGDGALLTGWPQTASGLNNSGWGYTGATLADIDGDGRADVISCRGTRDADMPLEIFRFDGTLIRSFPTVIYSGHPSTTPAVVDMDGDGLLELSFFDVDARLYMWDLTASASNVAPWPMFQHDAAHTGALVAEGSGACESTLLQATSATATSQENASTPATAAIDGSLSTRWSSAFSDPQSITIDLGAARHVNRVVLRWEAAASKDYEIQVSLTGSTWTTVFSDANGNGGNDDITGFEAQARYVRMVSRSRTTPWGNSLWEFEVYGDSSPDCDTQCIPQCSGRECGSDGCEGECGTCASGETCSAAGQCEGPSSCADAALSVVSATASSQENGNTPASAAIDGSLSTRWSSLFSDPQWLRLDLGARKHISRLTLNWEAAASANYEIQVSDDGSTWTRVRQITDGNGGIDEITGLGAKGRYVRIYSNARTTAWGNSLWEVQVFGDNDSECGVPSSCTYAALARLAASASSQESAEYPAGAAIDGSSSTRWSSLFSDPQWIRVDLGQVRSIERVLLAWEAAASRHYEVQVSDDGATWRSVFSDTAGNGGNDEVSVRARGRYVRVYSHARATEWGNSLWEVSVIGSERLDCGF